MHRLRFLEGAQWWAPDQVHAYRDRALVALLRVCREEVPFYRRLMDDARVQPGDIQTAADLVRLPIVTKAMLSAQPSESVTRRTSYATYEVRTSGSTGQNFQVLEDTWTGGMHRASFVLALQWAGWRWGEHHIQTGMTTRRTIDKRLKDFILGCHYVAANDLSDGTLDRVLTTIERKHIRHLWGYPCSLYYLAVRAAELGWNTPLRTIVTWGDMLYPAFRQKLESVFAARVTDTYGCAEGVQIAAQCGEGPWYHTHDLDVVVEYVGPDGLPVAQGQPGQVLLTRLHPGSMPLIRYRVGDLARSGGPETCACGRGFALLRAIQGRDSDVVVTPSGNRLVVHFFTGVLEHFPQIESFQVQQERHGEMIVRLVPALGFDAESPARIASALTSAGASDMQITVEPVREIPLTPGGKRRFVISSVSELER